MISDSTRNSIYSWFKQVPDKPTGGFEADVSGAVNQYVAGRTIFSTRQSVQGDRTNDIKQLTTGTGISPWGDNFGHPWNVTLLSDLIYQDGQEVLPGYNVNRKGFGYSLGAAFQLALNEFRLPWLPPPPVRGRDGSFDKDVPGFFFDRVQEKMLFAQTPLASFGVTSITEISFYLAQHIKIAPGIGVTYMPAPQTQALPDDHPWSFNFTLGLDLKF
jgi:hypothetical protein